MSAIKMVVKSLNGKISIEKREQLKKHVENELMLSFFSSTEHIHTAKQWMAAIIIGLTLTRRSSTPLNISVVKFSCIFFPCHVRPRKKTHEFDERGLKHST
jgi:hypothetical protein